MPTLRQPAWAGRRDWQAEYATLTAADRERDLIPDDLELLAVAAFLLGRDDEAVEVRERAFERYLRDGRTAEAFRCGFWLGFHLSSRGDMARAGGWRARLTRLVDDGPEGPLATMMLVPGAVAAMFAGDVHTALPLFDRALRLADRHGDSDTFVQAAMGRARCLAELGRRAESTAAVDEFMVHIATGRVAPQLAGLAYCVAISLCMESYDMRRAQEWTQVLSEWIEDQCGIVPYRGACLVHRAEIMQLHGRWTDAAAEADRARAALSGDPVGTIGSALYRIAELARLRGRLDEAEQAYTDAATRGAEVQPGLARLRLAQGRVAAAAAGLDRALAESPRTPRRAALLAARIDVALAAGDRSRAHVLLAETTSLVGEYDAPYLRALAEHCAGVVLVADQDPRAALPHLRAARAIWHELDAPYEAALTRCALATACAALGDQDGSRTELQAATAVLRQLGADVELGMAARTVPAHGLSPRELDVLRLIATGATNRAIAGSLTLSEKTVARHVSNIFGKLGVASRSAATAYAYEHELA